MTITIYIVEIIMKARYNDDTIDLRRRDIEKIRNSVDSSLFRIRKDRLKLEIAHLLNILERKLQKDHTILMAIMMRKMEINDTISTTD